MPDATAQQIEMEHKDSSRDEVKRAALANIDYGCFLDGPLALLRWLTLVPLFLIDVALPLPGRTPLPGWSLILIFAVYNLVIELLARRIPTPGTWSIEWFETFANVPYLDLPVVCILYFLAHEPADPIYVLFLLVALCAAGGMTARRSMVFTVVAMIAYLVLTPTLPGWSGSVYEARDVVVNATLLAMLGFGSTILIRQLRQARGEAMSHEHQAARLAELEQLRDQFVASISHDLRTPLTAAQSGLGMLQASAQDHLRSPENHLLETIRRNIERLRALIDDLLMYNQVRAGALRLDVVPLDLRDVVAGSVALVMPLIREKHQTLAQNLPAPLPVTGDERRLEQLITNIIVNANRHTPEGTHITISGGTISGGVEGDEVILRIADNGPGIPSAELDAIFQHFHRLNTMDAGSGLGLANARMLADLHQGRLWAEHDASGGAVFVLALPKGRV